jgi:hypothetical protein
MQTVDIEKQSPLHNHEIIYLILLVISLATLHCFIALLNHKEQPALYISIYSHFLLSLDTNRRKVIYFVY